MVGGRSAAGRRSTRVGQLAAVTSAGAAVVSGALTGYLGAVTLAALARRAPAPGRAPVPATPPRHRFAFMVPAHDEELGIAATLQSMKAVDYPADLYEIHVVADNCSDGTVAVVRAEGCTAHDRVAPDEPGKGPALNWLFARLHALERFDAYVVVDADTSVHPAFLRHMAAALDAGAEAAQGFYGVRDADTSANASFRLAALACRHHLRPLGRTTLGGSCGLFGNGMMFTPQVLEDNPWTGHLTEDMELQLGLLVQGRRVAYVPGAVVEAEMPATVEASQSQNERWELGRVQLTRTFVPKLARRVLTGPDRALAADALFDTVVPPMSVLAALDLACAAGATLVAIVHPTRATRLARSVTSASCVVLLGHVVAGLRSIDAPRHVYRSLLRAPASIAWKLGVWLKVVSRPEEVSWIRTTRNVER